MNKELVNFMSFISLFVSVIPELLFFLIAERVSKEGTKVFLFFLSHFIKY